MKKLLTLLLTLLMAFTLVGCGNNGMEEKPVDVPIAEVNEPAQEELVGGFIDAEDGTLTDELKTIFNKAIDGLLGAIYEPVELVATQVVAGTNYKFLANGTKTTNPVTKGTYYVTVYEDLDGNVSLLDIETIDEETVDPTQYSYWVVFKNPDGNELQRTIEKYGTTPVYTGDTPVYWDSENWYRFTNWDKELKPITGNTYITAEYELGGELKKEEVTPTPSPVDIEKLPLYQYIYDQALSEWWLNTYEYDQSQNKFIRITDPATSISDPGFAAGYYHKLGNQYIPCTDSEDPKHGANGSCLAKGTLITMADGSKKPIEDLKHGDDIKVFDHNTGKLSHAKIMDYWQYEEPQHGLMTLHFSNNIDVNIVDAHGFFNRQEKKYIVINHENVNKYIGKQFYNAENSSWEMLLGVTYSNKKVETFFLATEGEFNCVVEGMLNVEDDIYSLIVNIFDYDDEMKIDNQKKTADILKYGLFDYDDAPYLTKEGFDIFKIAYIKVAIGKGIITEEQWNEMVEENLSYESPHVSEDYSDQATKHSAR